MWSAVINRWRRLRRYLPWMTQRVRDQALLFAWCLITWSAFGWFDRAWAASIGLYIFFSVMLRLHAIRTNANAANRDR